MDALPGRAGAHTPPQASLLEDLRAKLTQCQEHIANIDKMADRACGAVGEKDVSGPRSVPNGLLDELMDMAVLLAQRLDVVSARLNRIA